VLSGQCIIYENFNYFEQIMFIHRIIREYFKGLRNIFVLILVLNSM
jgi:hypothetical protein